MRLVLVNAILGLTLTWAVLHDRTPADTTAPAPESDLATLPQGPEPPEPQPTPRSVPRLPPAADPPLALWSRSLLDQPKMDDPPPAAAARTRAERLAALDALAAEMEIFALDRRR